jgi:RNA polymerase sigma-70 factor (ECF subfamily)
MSGVPSFDDCIARLRAGDDAVAAQIFNRFANRLIALARSRLDNLLRQKVDPEDLLQSVFQSFFARNKEGQFDIRDWDSLWALLTVITLRKCGRRIEYFHAACRDVRREVTAPPSAEDSSVGWEAVGQEPSPIEAIVLAETLEKMLGLLEGRNRDIVTLRLQGCTTPEISAQLDCTERTVQRVLDQVKKWLQRRQAGEEDS